MISVSDKTFTIGKYLVSPLIRLTEAGAYAAAVSIRSGRGSNTHDRVFRFIPQFGSRESAWRFAADEAISWVHAPGRA